MVELHHPQHRSPPVYLVLSECAVCPTAVGLLNQFKFRL